MMMTRGTTLALAAGVVMLSVGIASAQVPIRVRGSIAKVSGQTLTTPRATIRGWTSRWPTTSS
jgi:hypothetical protein